MTKLFENLKIAALLSENLSPLQGDEKNGSFSEGFANQINKSPNNQINRNLETVRSRNIETKIAAAILRNN